jgi:hypothetical protein
MLAVRRIDGLPRCRAECRWRADGIQRNPNQTKAIELVWVRALALASLLFFCT